MTTVAPIRNGPEPIRMLYTHKKIGILPVKILLLSLLSFRASAQQQNNQPRVFLQSASKGNNWNATRDQSMEMAKDFQRDCPIVKITIAQSAADYTVLLNHIEVGLIVRDNQVQVADRNGDMLILHEGTGIKSGSIRGSVRIACRMITEDWNAKNQSAPLPLTDPPRSAAVVTTPPATTAPSEVPPQTDTQPETPKGTSDVHSRLPTAPSVSAPATSSATAIVTDAPPVAPVTSTVPTNANEGSLGAYSDQKPTVRHDGVTLSHVAVGGPSDKAGIMEGDVLLAIDGHYIYTVDEMNGELRRHKVGEHVSIRYRRFQFSSEAVVILGQPQ
jgi:hypothetical protein